MNLTRCSKGHFYDADAHPNCPHCLMSNGGETEPLRRSSGDNDVTVPLTGNKPQGNQDVTQANVTAGIAKTVFDSPASSNIGETVPLTGINQPAVNNRVVDDDDKTVRLGTPTKIGQDPVVGWLVCVGGAHLGEDFRLKTGRNFIGRSREMDVSLTNDKSVSRDRHAIVVYEPQRHIFHVLSGEARELCYLNDEVVLSSLQLKANDIISVGDSKLMFIPCCDDKFNWSMVEDKKDN